MLKKIVFVSLLTITSVMASPNDNALVMTNSNDNTFYIKNTKNVLKKEGYSDIHVLQQAQGYCTLAHKNFDWSAGRFEAVSKKGSHVSGVVCGNTIYLK